MKKRKYKVNKAFKVTEVEKQEPNRIEPLATSEDITYQGYDDKNDFYNQAKQGCFIYDELIARLVKRKFSLAEIEAMTIEQALEVFNALEKARATRSQFYLDICTKLSNDSFYNRQLELERGKLALNLMNRTSSEDSAENTTTVENSENQKLAQQKIVRLLQEAVQAKLDNKNDFD